MNDFNNIFPKILYHSYIVEGDPLPTCINLHRFLEDRGEVDLHSPDVLVRTYDSFTIDDSHKIKEWHSQMGVSNKKRVCIIGANFINHDAERTLLKIIEEPAVNTHFFIVVPNYLVLLDTIRSRAHVVSTLDIRNSDFKKIADEFIKSDNKKRIEIIRKLIKEYKGEESSSKLRFTAILLINEIEKIIFEKFKKTPKDKHLYFILEELENSRKFLNLPGSVIKMILENLALVI